MKHFAAAITAALVFGVSAPAGADPAVTITLPANAKAAATTPLTYVVTNKSRNSIMLSTSGGCGSYQMPMKPGAHLAASCKVADVRSTIAATTYPAKKTLCAAHINRLNGVNQTTFDNTPACTAQQGLNHIEIVVAPPR